jgi:hypothetical protein
MFSCSFKVAVWTLHDADVVQNAVANPEDRTTLESDVSADPFSSPKKPSINCERF